jgi:hypothetical protein
MNDDTEGFWSEERTARLGDCLCLLIIFERVREPLLRAKPSGGFIKMASQDHTSIEARLFRQLRDVHRLLVPYRHTALLAALIAPFLVRPLVGDNAAGLILFSTAMLLLLLLSLYNIGVDELVGQRKLLLAQKRR